MKVTKTKQKYTYKGNEYCIVSEAKVKINGVWEDAIIYQPVVCQDLRPLYVRTKTEFFDKFQPVKL